MRPSNRLIYLDIIRAIAIIAVLGRHFPEWVALDEDRLLSKLLAVWKRGGWVGVDLFFVLSGFLVSGLLFREFEQHGEIRPWHFLVRRGWKIYPSFYLMICSTLFFVGSTLDGMRIVSELLFLQNYVWSVWRHTWSLAVEEHFYILLVALFILLIRRNKKAAIAPFSQLPRIFAGVAVALLAGRIVTVWLATTDDLTPLSFPTHLRIDSLMFGVLLSYWYHFDHDRLLQFCRRPWLVGSLGLCLLTPAFVFPLADSPFMFTLGLTLLYVGSGLLLLAGLPMVPPKNLACRLLAFIGVHSYSIYLWHLFFADMLVRGAQRMFGERNVAAAIIAYVAGTILLGILMSRVVEIPMLKLRNRLLPSRSTSLQPETKGEPELAKTSPRSAPRQQTYSS